MRASSDTRTHVERLPQLVDRALLGRGADVDEDDNARVELWRESLKRPPVTVDLLGAAWTTRATSQRRRFLNSHSGRERRRTSSP